MPTPKQLGPWRAESNAAWGHCVRGGSRINVGTGREEEGYVAFRLNSMAIAKVIAAAPELLALAREVIRLDEENAGLQANDGLDVVNLFSLARSATAKVDQK